MSHVWARFVAAAVVVGLVGAGTTFAMPFAAGAATCGAVAVAQTSGPYYTANAPVRRTVTRPDTVGTPLILSGTVRNASCAPLAGAKVEFWQADGRGVYDKAGYRLRGTQFTDREGRYRLITVIPGRYPGRTEHIHVRITPPGGSTFTTQLYFPGSTHNDADGIFSPAMLVTVTSDDPMQMRARYTFVLPGSVT